MNMRFELSNIKMSNRLEADFKKPISKKLYRKNYSITLVVIIVIVTCMFGTVLANKVTGETFFEQYFDQYISTNSVPYADISQLSELSGITVGTVVDTGELRIDVMDVVSSGNDAMLALRITAKQLDTVLRDNGWEGGALNHYRFGSDIHGSLFESADSIITNYIYSDTDSSLAENEFYLIYSIMSLKGFAEESYTLELDKFGYYNCLGVIDHTAEINTVYSGPWTFSVNFGGDTQHSSMWLTNQSISVGKNKCTIEKIYLTPFSCTAVLSGQNELNDLNKDFGEFPNVSSNFFLTTADGQAIENEGVTVNGGNTEDKSECFVFHVRMKFKVPINIERVSEVHLLDRNIPVCKVSNGAQKN